MNETLTVIATRDGGPGTPVELGKISHEGFSWSGHDVTLGTRSGIELEGLIQIGGSVGRSFHLLDGSMLFLDCSIVGRGGPGNLYKLKFLRTGTWP